MVADKMVRAKWYGQNGMRTNCHWTKWYGQNGTDKMVWTKWYGQNGTNKTVPIKSSINRKFQTHWQYDFFINPASALIPLHFLCVLSTICDFWLLDKY